MSRDASLNHQWARVAQALGFAPPGIQAIDVEQPLSGLLEGVRVGVAASYEVTSSSGFSSMHDDFATSSPSESGFWFSRISATLPRPLGVGLTSAGGVWQATMSDVALRMFAHPQPDGMNASERLRALFAHSTQWRLAFSASDVRLSLELKPTLRGFLGGYHTLDTRVIPAYAHMLARIARALIDADEVVGVRALMRSHVPGWTSEAQARGLTSRDYDLHTDGTFEGFKVECRVHWSEGRTVILLGTEDEGLPEGPYSFTEASATYATRLLGLDPGSLPPSISVPELVKDKDGVRTLEIEPRWLTLTGQGVASGEAWGKALDELVPLGRAIFGDPRKECIEDDDEAAPPEA